MDNLMNRQRASAYIKERWGVGRSPGYLAKLATCGGGPVYRKCGRQPLYAAKDIDTWMQGQLSAPMKNTSEVA